MARIHSMTIEAPITKVEQFVDGLHQARTEGPGSRG